MAATGPTLFPGKISTALLHRLNPERNEARFYYVQIGPSLLDRWAVVRIWGRMGGQQRTMITPCPNEAEAQRLTNQLIRRRLHRGYAFVPSQEMRSIDDHR